MSLATDEAKAFWMCDVNWAYIRPRGLKRQGLDFRACFGPLAPQALAQFVVPGPSDIEVAFARNPCVAGGRTVSSQTRKARQVLPTARASDQLQG